MPHTSGWCPHVCLKLTINNTLLAACVNTKSLGEGQRVWLSCSLCYVACVYMYVQDGAFVTASFHHTHTHTHTHTHPCTHTLAHTHIMQPEGSPFLQMLEEVMTMDRNAMGHTLVRFYLAHGYVLPMLDMLAIREIHQTGETSGNGSCDVHCMLC